MKKNTIAKLLTAALCTGLIAGMTTGCGSASSASGENGQVIVYNWGEYIDPDTITMFEEETGIKVVYDEFETNEIMYPKVETGASEYDVICPSDYMISKMIENDLLSELNFDNMPNVKANIGEQYWEQSKGFDPENKYSVPYCWGTVGILYNKTMVEEPVDSWSILWDEKYADSILMQDSVRDAFMVALKLNGNSMNTLDETELAAARDLLIKQKPLVQAYVIDQVRDKMIGGEAALGVIYSGEAIFTQRENSDLEYVIPKEGTNVWIDSWVIPKNAPNKENAEKFIDFMCRGDVALKNFEYITYSTPNDAARDLIEDEDLKNSKIAFPDLVLSTMSNDFGSLKERAEKSGLFEAVFMFEEKEEHAFPKLARYHEDHGNLVFNLFSRMIFTKLYGKLQQPYVPVDFKKYQDIYVFCDSDPIGYYLNYKKIHYHAVEDGLDCICYYDTARYDNRGHFGLKAFLAAHNLIFIQNGYSKYCVDMEVNNTSILKYPCSKYIEQPREAMVRRLTQDDKNTILRIFMEDLDTLMTQLTTGAHHEHKVLVLTEPLCELPVREQIFRDIVAKYGKDAQVILKPHPRDVLDYHKLFPDDIVLDGKFPMEILNFIEGLEFDQVVSVYTVPDSIHFAKEKVFLGDDFMDLYEDPQKHRFNEQIF